MELFERGRKIRKLKIRLLDVDTGGCVEDIASEFRKQVYDFVEDYEYQGRVVVGEGWGLCASCCQFNIALTRAGNEKAHCDYSDSMRSWPSKNDAIKECTRYEKRGKLSLQEMANMATYLQPEKNRVGF